MIRGITKIRNEAHIIQDTLDNWAQYCDAIHVYDDNSTDGTVQICREHPAVVEVIQSNLIDPDRERAEWFNRQAVLSSARRFMGPHDWFVYFDGDEHLYQFDVRKLEDPSIYMASCLSFDTYITEEDKDLSEWQYEQRRWVGAEFEFSPYFYRASLGLSFTMPDQRNLIHGNVDRTESIIHGKVRHWGKGLSVKKFNDKCLYYAYIFGPKYAEKWRERYGQAVHVRTDFDEEMVLWDDILHDRIPLRWRQSHGVEVSKEMLDEVVT